MTVQIIHDFDHDMACLYCTGTMWTIGPVFSPSKRLDKDAEEMAEMFLDWISGDPQDVDSVQLEKLYMKFMLEVDPKDEDKSKADLRYERMDFQDQLGPAT